MTTESKEKYIPYPLFLLRDFFENRVDAINKILCYGIYQYSKKAPYTINDVARQTIYGIYRGGLSRKLHNAIEDLNSDIIGKDEDYNGFTGKKGFAYNVFSPDDEIIELRKYFNEYPNLLSMATEHYQYHIAQNSLFIKGDIERSMKIAKQIENQIPEKEPMLMIKPKLLFEFRDEERNKFQIAQFLAYVAIKSILGKRKYVKTNKQHIICRMFGYSSIKSIGKVNDELFKKYSTRYHIDKVLKQLELNWNVKIYATNIRGMFVSVGNRISIEDLVFHAESNKLKNKLEMNKNSKTKAKERALQLLMLQQQYGKNNNRTTTA